MAVPIQAGGAFSAGNPTALPIMGSYFLPVPDTFPARTYDLSSDGRRFLLIKEGGEAGDGPALTQFVVVLNWFEELRRLAPLQ